MLTNVALNTHQFLDYPSSDRQGSEASLNLVREWLAKCNSSHECGPLLPRSAPFRPTRLLYVGTADDFEDIFLSESETFPQDAKYATLSHCWGSDPIISLQKDLVSAFKKNIPWNQLPLSFQDALVVTRKLKIKFLWIDSLCIVQDDEEDWLRESMLMAEVYSHSYLNLAAAASSDSNGGLFRQRAPHFATKCLVDLTWSSPQGPPPGLFYCYQPDEWEIQVANAPLYMRGWVCQERLLAPRVLNFTRDQLFWECNDLHASESWPAGLPPRTVTVFKKDVLRETAQKQDLDNSLWAWNSVVRNYSAGGLTKSADKLVAISAIVRYFIEQKILNEQDYLAGLWRANMPQALMWKGPYVAGRPGGSTKRYGVRSQPYRAPSWSWASIDWTVTPATFGSPDVQTMAEVIDASTIPVANPIGAVKSGILRIRGFLLRAELETAEEGSFTSEDSCRLFLEGTPVDKSTARLDEVNTLPSSRFEVHLLPVKLQLISDDVSQLWVQGLLLQRTGELVGQFKRIGIFDFLGLDGFKQFLTGMQKHPQGEPECEERIPTTEKMRELCSWQSFLPNDSFPEPENAYTISIV